MSHPGVLLSPSDIRALLKEQGVASAGTGTVEGDLEVLSQELPALNLGVQIEARAKNGGKGKPCWKATMTGLTGEEARIVSAAIGAATFLENEERERILAKLVRTAEAKPPADVLIREPYSEIQGDLSVLKTASLALKAAKEGRYLKFDYMKAGSPRERNERRVVPAGVVFSAGHYYMMAEKTPGSLRPYRLERIISPQILDEAWTPMSPEDVQRLSFSAVNMFFSVDEPDQQTKAWLPERFWGIAGCFLAAKKGMAWLVEDMFGPLCARVHLDGRQKSPLPQGYDELIFFLYQRSYPLYGWLLGLGDNVQIVAPEKHWLLCKTNRRSSGEDRPPMRLEVFYRDAMGLQQTSPARIHAKLEHDHALLTKCGSGCLESYPAYLRAKADECL